MLCGRQLGMAELINLGTVLEGMGTHGKQLRNKKPCINRQMAQRRRFDPSAFSGSRCL